MVIDYTISIGNIAEVGSIILGGLFFLIKTSGKVTSFTNDMVYLKEKVKLISELVTSKAVMEKQILNIEEDIKDLRRGDGFIRNTKLGRAGVNKEYP